MEECCPSDFSRQRALVMTNPLPVMVQAVEAALADLPADASPALLELVLVQLDQLARRTGLSVELRVSLIQIADETRRDLTAGDAPAALADLQGALPALHRARTKLRAARR